LTDEPEGMTERRGSAPRRNASALAANVTSCVESAVRGVRLRPSGITVRARMPLVMRR
jgi:hypothetical protein